MTNYCRFVYAMFLAAAIPLTAVEEIKVPVVFDTLTNGLRIISMRDTSVAVVSCRLYYFVGSMYESAGYTGLSHMYEHMMFKGTKRLGTTSFAKEAPIMASIDSLDSRRYRAIAAGKPDSAALYRNKIDTLLQKQRTFVKKDEIWELYQNNGATQLNAWTSDDMTAYIATLPKNKLELFYWIESDRMQNPVLREFVSERDVVMEERRMRYDNRPIGRYWERLSALFFVANPYRNPTIGWASDIEAYSHEKLKKHINQYYTPDNALIVLAGNVDPVKAIQDIKRYFGAIPRAAQPRTEPVTREPAPIGETRFTVYDDASPRMDILFHLPGFPHDDLYKMDVIEGVFSGRSGRLFHRLVDVEGLCTSADAANGIKVNDGSFEISADLKNDADPARVEKIIREEIAKIATVPPTASEMARVKNEIRMSFVTNLKSLEGLSDQLAWFERLGSWKHMLSYPDRIAQVKPEDIPAAATKYLDPAKMTIGILLQKKGKAEQKTAIPKQKQ